MMSTLIPRFNILFTIPGESAAAAAAGIKSNSQTRDSRRRAHGHRHTTIQLISKPFALTVNIKCLRNSQLGVRIKYSFYNFIPCNCRTYASANYFVNIYKLQLNRDRRAVVNLNQSVVEQVKVAILNPQRCTSLLLVQVYGGNYVNL